MPRQAVALRHIPFEDLGSLAPLLARAGYEVRYVEATAGTFEDLRNADLLIVLGGPIGVYDAPAYPFLTDEIAAIRGALDRGLPTIGICLGSQLMAAALGSRVYPTGIKEIGWSELALTDAGNAGPLRHLNSVGVLHWHGDTFDLPERCELLASTDLCRNQAFARGANLLALQFHIEVEASGLETWLVGHACELSATGIDPADLRRRNRDAAPRLGTACELLMTEWLAGLE